ncbi:MAG: penicillin-binding transpeptidase domain-containing protein [Candidatus Omnitrophica bacterium]|nr:penicillin-binding transpeptidase domain-containing protein [Candidatus Omnitrophota bacterium]HOX54518.1 penicillin-binding transpeptidase domain-containing protein [Candidatus Omnitrophota bacterium]
MFIKKTPNRLRAVISFLLLALFFFSIKLILIQIFRSDHLRKIAQKQHNLLLELEPERGIIYDRHMRPLSTNLPAQSLYAVPSKIKNKNDLAEKLARITGQSKDSFLDRLNRKKAFIWLARKLPGRQYEEIKKINSDGLGFRRETKRYYPNAQLASQIIGFAGLDNIGLEGIELSFDKYLKGKLGWCLLLRDAKQRGIMLEEEFVPSQDGNDIVLTIDETIQFIAERALDETFKKHNARGATIVVINPKTGEILALANRPTFDLNNFDNSIAESHRNRAICDFYEPGSVFKIVTASAALEENKVQETDKFFCENGSYKVANHILHDYRPHGTLTFKEVMMQSSNIGVTKVAQILGPELVYKYAKLFGFGSLTGIDLPGEVQGQNKPPEKWSKTSIGAVPIGQEVCVTAIQLVTAISAIANDGVLMRPFVIKRIQDKKGEIIKEFHPQEIRRVITEKTAARMKDILAAVVAEGTGRGGQIPGYRAAGKTGTAQKVENGVYSHSKFTATFMGFVPVEDPKLAIVVSVDEPHPAYLGGTVSAPVFKRVAEDSLKYLKSLEEMELVDLNENKRAAR